MIADVVKDMLCVAFVAVVVVGKMRWTFFAKHYLRLVTST